MPRGFYSKIGTQSSDVPSRNVSTNDLMRFLDSTPKKAITRKTYTTTMSPFFNWLLERGVREDNPTTRLRLERVPQKFPRYLAPADVVRICEAIEAEPDENLHATHGTSQWLVPIVRTNVYFGLRAGEVVNLQWEHVDMERRRILVSQSEAFQTKSGKDRLLPICDEAYGVLEGLVRSSPFVFPSHSGQQLHRQYLSRRFKHFARKAGLPHLNFHATRHTAASWLAQSGCGIEAIRQYMGHSSISVSQKYMHLSPGAFARQINDAFDALGK